ncbi:hypothetical protein V2J09_022050 [Rumex salicifolius]
MDDYRRSHVPAFGSWDYTDGLPFTQCFETARQVRYGCYPEDRDLYVAGDLYQNDVVTPAVILVPRRRTKGRHAHAKKYQQEWAPMGYDSCDTTKEPPSPVNSPPSLPPRRPTPKAVDEDLYKIPPELLHSRPKRKRGLGFFSSCLLPVCA